LTDQRIQKLALLLWQSHPTEAPRPADEDVGSLIKFYKENKVSFLEMNERSPLDKGDSLSVFRTALREAYREEKAKYVQWRSSFIQVKKDWERLGLDYLFHKSTGSLPHLSDNLDVLVRPSDFSRAGKALKDLGYVNLRNVQEEHKELYRKLDGEEEWVPIHLHERVCWAVPFENNEHMWTNSLQSSGDEVVRHPSPEDAFLVTIAHCFLENHAVKLLDLWSVKKCLSKRDFDWEYCVRTATEMHWEHSLWTGLLIMGHLDIGLFNERLLPQPIKERAEGFVSGKRWIAGTLKRRILSLPPQAPLRIPHLWTRRHSSLRIIKDPTLGSVTARYRLALSYVVDGLIHRKLGINPHPRMFIALSGLDGSGKTRHTKVLQKAFRTCAGIESRHVWSRAGSLPLTHLLLRILRKLRIDYRKEGRRPQSAGEQTPARGRTALALWTALNALDLILFFFIKVRLPRAFGKVVIADRFVHDSLVDLERLRRQPNFERRLYRWVRRLAPQPDVWVFLDVGTDDILRRGCEESREELAIRQRLYRRLWEHEKVQILDNSRSFEPVSGELIRITLETFFRKYPQKYRNYRLLTFWY